MHKACHALIVTNDPHDIRRVNEFVLKVAAEHKLSEADTFAIRLAVEEACLNVMKYGFPTGEKSEISLKFEFDKDKVTITIVDRGVPFDPTKVKLPNVNAPLEERKVGGLGIYLIKNVMDEVHYERKGDMNVLRLVKYLRDGTHYTISGAG